MANQYYAVDGYHGGIYGHMPLGTWRDILEMLRSHPEWKISIDMEPVSWDALKRRDPAAYAELKEMLQDDGRQARIEIVAASYAQPYGWVTDGESAIRHLTYGKREIRKHFPWINVNTYAVQEPCWTSAMPQLLRSLGYERAVLKNPSTAWGGYCAGLDAEACLWVGPDGSEIITVPRYACEDLVNTWQTESYNPTPEFMEKCARNGIDHPSGMVYQDLGWRATPYVTSEFMMGDEAAQVKPNYVYGTWKDYISRYEGKALKRWYVTQEAFLGALPWGDQQLTHMTQQVRKGENALLTAERLDALRCAATGQQPDHQMDYANVQIMLAQHHDAWICASVGEWERGWAWSSCARVYAALEIYQKINEMALDALITAARPASKGQDKKETVALCHLLGRREMRYTSIPLTCLPGTRGYRVTDANGTVLSQFIPNREYADGSWNAGELLVYSQSEGFGMTALQLEAVDAPVDAVAIASAAVDGDVAIMENDLYSIRFDLGHGGRIVSMVSKETGHEWVKVQDGAPFNGYKGYFVDEGRFISSEEAPATAEIVQSGPLQAMLRIRGSVGKTTFVQELKLRAFDPVLHVQVTFVFPEKTRVGDPFEIPDEIHSLERHRSYHDGRYKLNALFPTAFAPAKVFKDAAFDVCESNHADSHFQRWDEIKHNILISWAEVNDGQRGLTVFSDTTTSYTHGDGQPFGLTMAWAGDGGYWWRHRRLSGAHSMSYGIMPHEGDWRAADVWHEGQKRSFPAVVRRMGAWDPVPALDAPICIRAARTELSTAFTDDTGAFCLRLFNPGRAETATVALPDAFAGRVERVELDGRIAEWIDTEFGEDARRCVKIEMPAFAVRTLRLHK